MWRRPESTSTNGTTGRAFPFKAAIPDGDVRGYCNFSAEDFAHYKTIIEEQNISTRSMVRLAKVARTVADLRGSETLDPPHIDEAGEYVIGGMLREAF